MMTLQTWIGLFLVLDAFLLGWCFRLQQRERERQEADRAREAARLRRLWSEGLAIGRCGVPLRMPSSWIRISVPILRPGESLRIGLDQLPKGFFPGMTIRITHGEAGGAGRSGGHGSATCHSGTNGSAGAGKSGR